jgi:hypothetical protein
MRIVFNIFTGKFDYVLTGAEILAALLPIDGAGSLLDADFLDGLHASSFQALIVDTKANILALNRAIGQLAYATDTYEIYVSTGVTTWKVQPFDFVAEAAAPDMGFMPSSSRIGYGDDYITDKSLANVLIGGNARTENGGIRVNVSNDPDTLEVYLRGAWYTIIYDFTTAYGDLRHTPLSEQIYVWRGDSVAVGLNSRPIIQEYEASMGAFPPPRVLYGGAF